MSAAATSIRYTPEDLLTMPDGNLYELENGQLVETPVSVFSSLVGSLIHLLVGAYCQRTGKGWAFASDNSYQCFPDDPERVRKADVSFIRRDRISHSQLTAKGHCRVTPDLVVEVLSPNDIAYEVDAKIQLWLNAGVQRVWVVNPEQKTMEIHRPTGMGAILHETDEVKDDDILPGFHCRLAEFFQIDAEATNGDAASK